MSSPGNMSITVNTPSKILLGIILEQNCHQRTHYKEVIFHDFSRRSYGSASLTSEQLAFPEPVQWLLDKLHHKALPLWLSAMVVAAWYLFLFTTSLSPHFLSNVPGPSLPSPLCELVQQSGFIPEAVLTCQVI